MIYYYREPTLAERYGGCLGFLVILGILIAVAAVFGFYVLLFFLGVGLFIGLVFSLSIYIRSLINAIRQLAASPPVASNAPFAILKGWVMLFVGVTKNSIGETIQVVQNNFQKFLAYPIISFQKWMWLTVTVAVAVCEVIFIIAISLLQVGICVSLAFIIACLVGAALLICIVAALGYTAVIAIMNMVKNIPLYLRMDHCNFSSASCYRDLGAAWGLMFHSSKGYISAIWEDTSLSVRNFFALSGASGFLSPLKYFYLATSLTVILCCGIFNILFLILYSIAFILVWIANALWTTVVTVFRRIRH